MPKCYEQLCAAFVGAGMIALFRRWLLDETEDASLESVAKLSEILVFDGLHGVAQTPSPKRETRVASRLALPNEKKGQSLRLISRK